MILNTPNCFATLRALSFLYGKKKVEVLFYIIKHCDNDLVFKGTYKQIMEDVCVSKPTIVELFKELKKHHLVKKEKNAYYKLSEKIFEDFVFLNNANQDDENVSR